MKAPLFIFPLVLAWTINIVAAQSKIFSKLCSGKHGDFLQHPQDCSKFIRCSHNQAFEFQCTDNLLWHHEIKSCDYSRHVKCTIKENLSMTTKTSVMHKTIKPVSVSKFKREIKTTKNKQKLSTVLKKLSALPTPTTATKIYTTATHFPDFTFQASTLSKNLFKITKNHTTILRSIKANISNNVDLTKNHTKITTDNVNIVTKNLVNSLANTSTTAIGLTTQQVKTDLFDNLTPESIININTEKLDITTPIELPTQQAQLTVAKKLFGDTKTNPSTLQLTADQVILSKTKNISVNLTDNFENLIEETFLNSTANQMELIRPFELPRISSKDLTTDTSAIELTTDYVELKKTTNLCVNLAAEILVNSTVENIINLKTDKFELTSPNELPTKTKNVTGDLIIDSSAIELTTDDENFMKTTSIFVNLTTQTLVNSTAKTFITNKFELSRPIEFEPMISFESENLTTNQLKLLSKVELSTEQTKLIETTESLAHLTAETLVDLPTIPSEFKTDEVEKTRVRNLIELTSENSVNFLTTQSHSTDDTLQSSTAELPTDQENLREMTNELINLTENFLNLLTLESDPTTPNDSDILATTKTELIADHLEKPSSKSKSITQQLEFSHTVELTTAPVEWTETTYSVNLARENSKGLTTATDELSKDQLIYTSTPMLNTDRIDSSSLHTDVATENFENSKTVNSADIEKETVVNLALENFTTESPQNFSTKSTTDVLAFKSSNRSVTEVTTIFTTTENFWQKLTQNLAATTKQTEIDTISSTQYLLSDVLIENNKQNKESLIRTTTDSEETTNSFYTTTDELTNFMSTITEKTTNFISTTPETTNFFSKSKENSTSLIRATTEKTKIFNITTEENFLESILNSAVLKSKEGILPKLSSISRNSTETTPAAKTMANTATETITTGSEILTEFSVTTNKISIKENADNLFELTENSTLIDEKMTDQSYKDEAIGSETTLGSMKSTLSTIIIDSSTTIDSRLPFRSPACQGVNNRRQFMAARCYQYYQCFAGWAFLLNCHDGWLFQIDIGACTQDVNNECEI